MLSNTVALNWASAEYKALQNAQFRLALYMWHSPPLQDLWILVEEGVEEVEGPEMVDNGGEILSFVYSLTAVHMDSLTLWQHVERMDLCNFQYDCYIVYNGLFSRIALNNIRNKTSMLDIKCWVYTFRLRCIHTIYMHIYMRNKITKIGDFLST